MPFWKQIAMLSLGFLLGVCLMGVEMASIRMMTPYFGSGIEIWASMIATVMLAMMMGYYVGGMLADRAPRSDILGAAVMIAGLFVAAAPSVGVPLLDWTLQNVGYDVGASLMASAMLLFVPLTLLSFFSPYAVRLLLADAQHGGRVAGSVYSITTVGNIVGTLGTALVLMRFFGNQHIMYIFAAGIFLCGLGLLALRIRANV